MTRIRELAGLDGDGRSFHYKEDDEMTEILLTCPRFTSIGLVGFRNIIDVEKQEQFAAVTMLLPNRQKMIVFRGTDKTLTGWKEDFNMMYLEHVPSQEDAVKYIEEAAAALDDGGDIYICGHSKGGNKSKYITLLTGTVDHCVSFDGQGFGDDFLAENPEGVAKASPKITYISAYNDFVNILLTCIAGECIYVANEASAGAAHSSVTLLTSNSFDEKGNFKRN